MRKNWPYFIVASFLNAVFITGAFIEFKLRGMGASQQPTWYEINPFVFTGGIFITSFLIIMGIVVIFELIYKLQATDNTRKFPTNRNQLSDMKHEIGKPLQPVTWNL